MDYFTNPKKFAASLRDLADRIEQGQPYSASVYPMNEKAGDDVVSLGDAIVIYTGSVNDEMLIKRLLDQTPELAEAQS